VIKKHSYSAKYIIDTVTSGVLRARSRSSPNVFSVIEVVDTLAGKAEFDNDTDI